ncbi:hypothetical protein RUM43_012271 [Polyplax serrata]|uniref:Tetratricopeptide repeat protein 29 n=1 Tax=Polyplax serrata TaxID=468196 RepID=A0AAN8S352_POLSC
MSQEQHRFPVVVSIKCKKLAFDEAKFGTRDPEDVVVVKKCERRELHMGQHRTGTDSEDEFIAYCYWYPKLFGVDEVGSSNLAAALDDSIPSSDDEGIFDEFLDEELEEKASALTSDELKELRTCYGNEALSDAKVRKIWKKQQVPRYGRRAKPKTKPILERENKEQFECLCDIDRTFSRHYVPRYGGGVEVDGMELKTPHFIGFWETFKERAAQSSDMDEFEKVIEPQQEEKVQSDEKGLLFRPLPKMPNPCKSDIQNFRQQLLSSFRPLECREIRRYRMPFSEALYLELQEDRYFDSAHFFKNLIIKDYFASKSPDYVPTLTRKKGRMKHLISFLKIAEKFSRRKEYQKEAITLLKSGKYFNDHNENWWWVAEELYKKAVKVSRKSAIDGGKMEAIARYILGTFYLECVHRVQLAQEHLSKARELSLGKDWNAERILNKKQEPVHKECSNYLCQALIASSKELRKNGKPEKALPLIHRSYKLCLESKTFRRDIEMETYFELGLTYQALGMLEWAKVAFKKFMEIAKLENYPRSVCDGYLELAITYRSEGDLSRCHHSLTYYLETAETNKDENLIAFANRYLGEYHLNNGNSGIASQFFENAFQSFHKQFTESLEIPINSWKPEYMTLAHDVELSRVLLGLAKGEVMTKQICHLIIKARGAKNKKETLELINWKNKKDTFSSGIELETDELTSFYEIDSTSDYRLTIQGSHIHEEPSSTEAFYKSVRFADDDTAIV